MYFGHVYTAQDVEDYAEIVISAATTYYKTRSVRSVVYIIIKLLPTPGRYCKLLEVY